MLLTKFPEILGSIASAFTTLHHRFPPQVSHLLAVYFSIMNLEQSVKDLQAQNAQFQDLILNLSKGQEELKALLFLGYNYNARCAYYSNNPCYDVKDGRPLKCTIKDLIMTLKSEKITTTKSRQLSHDNGITTTEPR